MRCDRFELPERFVAYWQTAVFTEQSVPARLRQDQSTAPGVWAKILVTDGKLRYHVDALDMDIELSQNRPGIVAPEVPHRVEPLGAVRFFLEFYRSPDHAAWQRV